MHNLKNVVLTLDLEERVVERARPLRKNPSAGARSFIKELNELVAMQP